ncbi:hypothetical protein LXL04_024010 [Taraxacum kok-saghyz]
MTSERREMWSWTEEVLPICAMLMLTCLDIGLLTIVKVAMNDGMNSFVYIVYHNVLGTLILLPFFFIHIFRMVGRPPLTFHILFRFFILGLLGVCLFPILLYIGVGYSSPTLASAIGNLTPVNTFLIAVAFRMEKIDIRSSNNRAKLFGTIIAISGAMVFTFYKGPEMLQTISFDSHNGLRLSQGSDWIFGGLILVINGVVGSIWNVLQVLITRFIFCTSDSHMSRVPRSSHYCLFLLPLWDNSVHIIMFVPGKKIQVVGYYSPGSRWWLYVPVAPNWFKVQHPNKKRMKAVYFTVLRNTIVTWCLKKKGPVFVAMFSPLSIVIAITMGVTFLGDSLYLGSAIGATIIVAGFYTVMWGQAKEKKVDEGLDIVDEAGSSNHENPLLSDFS